MRKKTIMLSIAVALFIVLQLSCSISNSQTNEQMTNTNKEDLKKPCPKISSDTASLIAQGYMYLDYRMSNFEPKVETETELYKEYGEMWKVTFVSKSKKTFGDPIVWVLKSNGEVFTVMHRK